MANSTAISPSGKGRGKNGRKSEFRLDGIRLVSVDRIRPAPENDELYRPISDDDPDIIELSEKIRKNGFLTGEPIVLSTDSYILSGHRRFAASRVAGRRMVPCITADVSRTEDRDRFLTLLREYNRQRVKSFDEVFREEAISVDPNLAHHALKRARYRASSDALEDVEFDLMDIPDEKERAEISAAKIPFLEAIKAVIEKERKFWPISKRKIHYGLLNDPPLKHASKPHSRYVNDDKSWDSLLDLSTRAQFAGLIPWDVISDDTRPIFNWDVFPDVGAYIHKEFGELFTGYWRDLQRSQPNHIEIVGEKNTLRGIIRPVAGQYTIPLTLGRGYCSSQPRRKMAERFRASGKERLVLLILCDHDPDGDYIAGHIARSMRDDFGLDVEALRVALTMDQVRQLDLAPGFVPATAKRGSKAQETKRQRFIDRYGSADVHELEAVPSAELQTILRSAVESVMDMDLYRREEDREREDAAHLEKCKRKLMKVAASIMGPEFGCAPEAPR